MIVKLLARWRIRRHRMKHERERKELESRILELEQVKRFHQEQLEELEYHEKLWNSVQLDK